MTEPAISVIVPVWNDEKRIGSCIEALQRQTLPRELYEIIVVDNGSTDRTVDVVASHEDVVLLHEAQPGSYAARNTGLARARGEYVAFTDSDCVPDPGWLVAGFRAVEGRGDIGVAAGRIVFTEPDDRYSRSCLNFERLFSMRQDENAQKGFAITANWFSRKQLILDHGGFDARLKSGGDYQLSGAIAKSGLHTLYLPDAVVRHPARACRSEIAGKTRRVVGGRWASEPGRLRFLKRLKVDTKNLLERTKKIVRASDLSLWQRLEVMVLLLQLWAISIFELLRLQLGGAPRRS